MDQITLSGGDMGGTVMETETEIGGEFWIESTAGETAGRLVRYRRDTKTQAVYTGLGE